MSGGVLFKSQVGPSSGHFSCHFQFSSPLCLLQSLPGSGSHSAQCSSHLWKFLEYNDTSASGFYFVLFLHISSLGQLFQDDPVLSKKKKLLKRQGKRSIFKCRVSSYVLSEAFGRFWGGGVAVNSRETCQRLFKPPLCEVL